MKTKILLKKMAVLAICLATVFVAKAQTATSFADLQTKFAEAVASGVPTTINIGAAIVVDADYSMVSTGDTITLNMVPFNISVTSGTLTIGNKVKVVSAVATAGALQAAGGNIVFNAGCYIAPSTGNTVQALTGSKITINGGTFNSTATAPVVAAGGDVIVNGGIIKTNNYPAVAAGMAINTVATGGLVTINGGLVYTTSGGIARGIVVDYNGVCTVNGGEVRSDMGGGRGISINGTNAGGKLYVYGGLVSAIGATGRAIQLDNNNSTLWVTGGTITGGLEAIMVQKMGVAVIVANPTITGTIGTNTTTSKLYDARGLGVPVATPGEGYYAASQDITITGGTGIVYKYVNTTSQASATTVNSSLVYTTNGTDPVVASSAVTAPITVAIPSVLKVAAVFESTTVSPSKAFNYWPLGVPMTSAPMPTVEGNKVVSIFSDIYPNAAGSTNYNPGWGQATIESMIKIGNDNVLKYANLNYQGTEFGNHVNAADMTYMHIDVFTSNETVLQITPISPGKEFLYTFPVLNQNSWNSYNIPLTVFASGNLNWADLFQIKVVGAGGNTVYLDNIYFYTDAAADAQAPTVFTATKGVVASDAVELLLNATDNSGAVFFDITYGTNTVTTSSASSVQKSFTISGLTGSTDYTFSIVARDRTGNAITTPIVVEATTLSSIPAAPTPTVDASKVISIFSDAYTNIEGTDFNPGWGQSTQETMIQLGGNNTLKYANFNYQGVALGSHVDATAMNKLHVDIYPIDETSIGLTPISPAHEKPTLLGTLTPNQWNSFDITLSTYTGVIFSDIFQFKFDQGTGKTFYMDNLYFYNDATGINDITTKSAICYPSTVINSMNVSADSQISSISVRNLLGQLVKIELVDSNKKSIDLSVLTSGNYLVTIKLVNGETINQKIIKL